MALLLGEKAKGGMACLLSGSHGIWSLLALLFSRRVGEDVLPVQAMEDLILVKPLWKIEALLLISVKKPRY